MKHRQQNLYRLLAIRRHSGITARLSGFTLVELLVVVGIIAILAGITVGISNYAARKAGISRALAEMETIKAALEEYRLDRGEYYVVTGTVQLTTIEGFSNEVGRFSAGGIRLEDPWGRGYYYTTHDRRPAFSFRLYSEGPSTNTAADNIDTSSGPS